MTPVNARHFRCLLRWYPRTWRERNGDVFIATLLEVADAEGRSEPTAAERRSAILHGVSTRLDRRLAVSLSLAALLLSATLSTTTMLGFVGDDTAVSLGYPLLTTFVAPVLTATALVAALRDRGWMSDTRALSTIAIFVLALALATLASASWGLGLDSADTGAPPPPLARWWGALTVTGIIAGTIGLSLLADSLLRRTAFPPLLRMSASLIAGAVGAPLLGLAMLTPESVALAAMSTLVLALVSRRTLRNVFAGRNTLEQSAGPFPTHPAGSRTRALRIGCGLVAVSLGSAGMAYALTGALWIPGTIDATRAMRDGIVVLLFSALPLLVGVGTRVQSHRAHRQCHTWGPIALAGVSLTLLAMGYRGGPEWEQMAPWFVGGSLSAGTAIAWWIIPRAPLSRRAASLVGSGAGFLFAAVGGFMIVPLLAFLVPVWGVVLLMNERSSRRSQVAQLH